MTEADRGKRNDKAYRDKVRKVGLIWKRVMIDPHEEKAFDQTVEPFRKRAKAAFIERTGGPVKGRNADGKFAQKREPKSGAAP